MLNIQIDENYKLTSDPHNIILQKRRIIKEGENAGTEEWGDSKYYGNIRQAVDAYCKQEIIDLDAVGFDELYKKLDELKDVISQIPEKIGREFQK